MREAAMLVFLDPLPEQCLRLTLLSKKEWQRLIRWLDISGLALYFFDRLSELNLLNILPPPIFARLQQNLIDNTQRIDGMVEESLAIHRAFQTAGLTYATLKGFSLWPASVPKLELRSQLDLDFLVAKTGMFEAQKILEHRGYHLHAISGRSWEFKINQESRISLKDMYKPTRYRCVELHAEAIKSDISPLTCAEWRVIHGMNMPVLSPINLFLGQGMHLYKHISHDFARVAHLIEFRRHVLARHSDDYFWAELQQKSLQIPQAAFGLGLITLLITHLMGDFAPERLINWTVDQLPPFAPLWIEKYGARVVFANFPGCKLHLLLQKELEVSGIPPKRARLRELLPLRLPPAVVKTPEQENWIGRLLRYYGQISFICFRLRFHTVGGLGYLIESFRWRKYTSHSALHTSRNVKLQRTQQSLPGYTKE